MHDTMRGMHGDRNDSSCSSGEGGRGRGKEKDHPMGKKTREGSIGESMVKSVILSSLRACQVRMRDSSFSFLFL